MDEEEKKTKRGRLEEKRDDDGDDPIRKGKVDSFSVSVYMRQMFELR